MMEIVRDELLSLARMAIRDEIVIDRVAIIRSFDDFVAQLAGDLRKIFTDRHIRSLLKKEKEENTEDRLFSAMDLESICFENSG